MTPAQEERATSRNHSPPRERRNLGLPAMLPPVPTASRPMSRTTASLSPDNLVLHLDPGLVEPSLESG